MTEVQTKEEIFSRLNKECSRIDWQELQKFFAGGATVYIEPGLDLIDIAAEFSLDNKPVIEPLVKSGKMGPVKDEQAAKWFEDKVSVWAVVIAPWVLVQPITEPKE